MTSVANIILHDVFVLSGADTNNVLFRLRKDLRHMVDPDFLLPVELMRRGVLSDEDRQEVKRKYTYQERNDVLLNSMIQKKDTSLAVALFTECLHSTDQDHVCTFIMCDGGKQTFFSCDSDWFLYNLHHLLYDAAVFLSLIHI